MPIFEFKCTCDGIVVDELIAFKDIDKQLCAKCGNKMIQVVSYAHGYVKGTENHCFN